MHPEPTEARRLDALGEVDAAVDAWIAYTEAHPGALVGWFRRCQALLRAGRWCEATTLADALVVQTGGAAPALATRARVHTVAGEDAAAAALLRRAAAAAGGPAMARAAERAARRAAHDPDTPSGLVQRFGDEVDWTVQSGPFAGLVLPPTPARRIGPLLAGTHEHELHAVVETMLSTRPRTVVCIGAAEGYYALGLARRLPQSRVIAFEAAEARRRRLMEGAARNRVVDRLDIRGLATVDTLPTSFDTVISDCEGAELWLLRPERAPALRTAAVLVEAHDFLFAGITDILVRRFAPTHDIARIPATSPLAPALPGFTEEEARRLVAEPRPTGMVWLWMRPRR